MANDEGFLDWAISAAWDQILSLGDLSNPFTIYFYLLLAALIIRYVLVIFPLMQIRQRWKNEDDKFVQENWKKFSRFKNSISKGIWGLRKKVTSEPNQDDSRLMKVAKKMVSAEELRFKKQRKEMKEVMTKEGMKALHVFILTEIIIALGPGVAALSFRLFAGSPSENEWSSGALILLISVFVVWFMYQIIRSFNVKKALEPLQRYYADPLVVKAGLTATLWSRKQLKALAELDTSDRVPFHQMKFKKKFDKEGIIENANEVKTFLGDVVKNARALGESGTKIGAGVLKEQMDTAIVKQTKNYLGEHSSLKWTLAIHIILTFLPVIAIYMLN